MNTFVKTAFVVTALLLSSGCASAMSSGGTARSRDVGPSMGPVGFGAVREADSPRNIEPRYERPVVERQSGFDRDRPVMRFSGDCPRCR